MPELAQNPEVDGRLVISPYSTMLALALEPRLSVANLRKLEYSGLKGPMGFYEAIDYSITSTREGSGGVFIYAYMAHHQGMTMAALDNLDPRRISCGAAFHSDPRIRAVESILYERIPLARLACHAAAAAACAFRVERQPRNLPSVYLPAKTVLPQTLLLGNGVHSVMVTKFRAPVTADGTSSISPGWRADSTLDHWGTFVLLRESRSNAVWSATSQPLNGDRGEASATFSANRAEFRRVFLGIETTMSVVVSADDDVEVA